MSCTLRLPSSLTSVAPSGRQSTGAWIRLNCRRSEGGMSESEDYSQGACAVDSRPRFNPPWRPVLFGAAVLLGLSGCPSSGAKKMEEKQKALDAVRAAEKVKQD